MADRLQPISKDMLQADWGDETGLSGFGQQAAKNWLFLRVFPFIVGDWVNMESEQWAVLEKLLAICSILVSPIIHVESHSCILKDINQRFSVWIRTNF